MLQSEDKPMTGQESLALITQMIRKAKQSYYDTGISAIMWGSVVAFCSLEKLAELHFGYRLPFDIYLLTFAAVIPQLIFSAREKKEKKARSFDDPYLDYIWTGFGISIFLMVLVVNVITRTWGQVMVEIDKTAPVADRWWIQEFISPLFLLLYGIPTFITGAATRLRAMLWGGLFCWACCIITLFTSFKIDLLLTAASAVMAWLIPGIIMERQYRQFRRKQQIQDV